MGFYIKIESFTEDGAFEAAVNIDDGKVAKTHRYFDGEQAEFLQHVGALMTPKLLVSGRKDGKDAESSKSDEEVE